MTDRSIAADVPYAGCITWRIALFSMPVTGETVKTTFIQLSLVITSHVTRPMHVHDGRYPGGFSVVRHAVALLLQTGSIQCERSLSVLPVVYTSFYGCHARVSRSHRSAAHRWMDGWINHHHHHRLFQTQGP